MKLVIAVCWCLLLIGCTQPNKITKNECNLSNVPFYSPALITDEIKDAFAGSPMICNLAHDDQALAMTTLQNLFISGNHRQMAYWQNDQTHSYGEMRLLKTDVEHETHCLSYDHQIFTVQDGLVRARGKACHEKFSPLWKVIEEIPLYYYQNHSN